MGMTLAILSCSGKIPVVSDWFIIKVRGLIRLLWHNFKILLFSPSIPELDFDFKYLIISQTLFSWIEWNSNTISFLTLFKYDWNGRLLFVSIEEAYLGPMFVKNLLNSFAISVLSVAHTLLSLIIYLGRMVSLDELLIIRRISSQVFLYQHYGY